MDCEITEDNFPLEQGDIFVYKNWLEREARDRMGVVLTADCDISQNKFGQYLSYLPLLRLEDYVDSLLVPRSLERQTALAIKEIRELILKGRKNVESGAQAPSDHVIESWILTGGVADFKGLISLSSKELERLSSLKEVSKNCINKKHSDSQKKRSLLMQIQGVIQRKKESERPEMLRKDIQNSLHNLPQDVYFVSDVPGLPAELANGLGYCVQLREIRPIPAEVIGVRLSEIQDIKDGAMRVARLKPTYKYALTQKFSYLFSRIGLPENFEEEQREIINLTCRELKI